MNLKISTLLVLLACATRAFADATIGSVSVGSQSPAPVMPGSNAIYTVTATRAGSGNVDVYLTITNLPVGVSATFVPSLLHFSGGSSNKTSALTLSITAMAPGTYNFMVVGRDGGSPNFKTATGTLVVGSASNIGQGQPAGLAIQKLPQGSTQLTCTGPSGRSYQIQATADLANPSWALIGTATNDQFGACNFIDANASQYSQRFYRTLSID